MQVSAKVIIEGTKPFLFCSFNPSVLSEKASKGGGSGNNPDEWKSRVLYDEKRNLFFYNSYLLGSIKSGGKYVKEGRGNLAKRVASTLDIMESKIFLNNLVLPDEANLLTLDSEPVYLDIRAVVNPMTKGKNVRYRVACKAGWSCNFIISWDDYVLSKDSMKVCLENAGTFIGIGDGRAIGFGRYKVKQFKISEE